MSNRVKDIKRHILSHKFFKLSQITFDYQLKNEQWVTNTWEVLERGNAAAALLYNLENRSIILVKQFRLPAYLNGHDTGFLLEVPAGVIDNNDVSSKIAMQRELLEETGYHITNLKKVYEAYATPGGSTERFSCFVGAYDASMKIEKGGGLDSENEDIEIIEMAFDEALDLLENGKIIDAKTIMLLQHAQIKIF
ncbi:NUDIX domain-containing protein [Psychroserpens damuponensis]|uniref:NUDIX domain-containing protein n=1 Tax=Psychroserpens damuponensis TaxID=943936 RepID=UPI00058F6DBD|nr:NUDIX domain-containing protein [Psychroserpens damuponensis]